MTGNGQIFVHDDAARLVDRNAHRFSNKRSHVARRPNLHPARNEFVADLQSGVGQIRRVNAGAHFDAELFQLLHRARGQVFRKTGKDALLALHQNHARTGRIDVPEILLERVARDLGNRSRHFHAGRTATDDDEGHRGRLGGFVRDFFRVFEGQQKTPADFHRVLEALQARREFLPFVMSEIGMPRAGREDEIIVGDFPIADVDGLRRDIDRFHFRQNHFRVRKSLRMPRIGAAMSAGESAAVATWYRSG